MDMDLYNFTVRLPESIKLDIDIMSTRLKVPKAKIIRGILSKFLEDNREIIDQYYYEIKENYEYEENQDNQGNS